MGKIRIVKRTFGNFFSKSMSFVLAVIALVFMINYNLHWFHLIYMSLLVCTCPIFLFGREIIEIDPKKMVLKKYYQILFFVLWPKTNALPTIDYFLIREMNAHVGEATLSGLLRVYEINFVYNQTKRYVLCQTTNKTKILSTIKTLKLNFDLPIKNNSSFDFGNKI